MYRRNNVLTLSSHWFGKCGARAFKYQFFDKKCNWCARPGEISTLCRLTPFVYIFPRSQLSTRMYPNTRFRSLLHSPVSVDRQMTTLLTLRKISIIELLSFYIFPSYCRRLLPLMCPYCCLHAGKNWQKRSVKTAVIKHGNRSECYIQNNSDVLARRMKFRAPHQDDPIQ